MLIPEQQEIVDRVQKQIDETREKLSLKKVWDVGMVHYRRKNIQKSKTEALSPPKEGERSRTTRLPLFPLHVAVFVSAILYLVLVGIEYRHEWVGGVVDMATLSFMLCFLLSIALFMNDPDHGIWEPTPARKLVLSIQEALKNPNS